MDYDIYFHDDFDGRASAAIMLNFLESRGDKIKTYVPIRYDIRPKWAKLKFPRPTIIVDFYYHPKAAFWFDHHPTTFIKPEWKEKFRGIKTRHFEPRYASACHLVLDALKKYFGYRPPQHLVELARWLDVIDSAKYKSAKQTIEAKEPALRVCEFIEEENHNSREDVWIIGELSQRSLTRIARVPRIQKRIALIKKKKEQALEFYRAHLQIFNTTAFIDLSRTKTLGLRFAPYYLCPFIRYQVALKKGRGGIYHVGVGANPWRRGENRIDIGAILRERYKGGGHRNVGGAEFTSRRAAEKAVRETIALLR